MSETVQPVASDVGLQSYLGAADAISGIDAEAARLSGYGARKLDASDATRLKGAQSAQYRALFEAQLGLPQPEVLQAQQATVKAELDEILGTQGALLGMSYRELEEELVGDIRHMTGDPTSEEDLARAAIELHHSLQARADALSARIARLGRAANLIAGGVRTGLLEQADTERIRAEVLVSQASGSAQAEDGQVEAARQGERNMNRPIEAAALFAQAQSQGASLTRADMAQALFGSVDHAAMVQADAILRRGLESDSKMARELRDRYGLVLERTTIPNPRAGQPKQQPTLKAYRAVPISLASTEQ
jgi:hypothetical protein